MKVPPDTIYRFQTSVNWLSVNSMNEDKKAETLAMFDFDDFDVEDLATVVKNSGLYPSEKIIERMEELFNEQREEMEALKSKNRALKRKIKM